VAGTAALPGAVQLPANAAGIEVRIRGVAKSAGTILQANFAGQVLADQVNITVKRPKNITVAIFDIGDSRHGPNRNGLPFPVPPTQQEIGQLLTRAFTIQSAINIQISGLIQLRFPWDNDLNGSVDHPAGARGAGEFNTILNAPAVRRVQADYKIFFVDGIVPIGNVLEGDVEAVGFSVFATNAAVVSTWNVPALAALNKDQIAATAGHELGHLLGLREPALADGGHHPQPHHLMSKSIAQQAKLYELDKFEWDVINP
jgi:hypothetical protein